MEFYILASSGPRYISKGIHRYISKGSNQIKDNLLIFLPDNNQVNLYFILYKISLKQFLVLFLSNVYLESWVALLSNTTVFRKELFLWAHQYVLCGVTQMSLRDWKSRQTYVSPQTTKIQNFYLLIFLYAIYMGFPLTFGKYIFSAIMKRQWNKDLKQRAQTGMHSRSSDKQQTL